MSDEPTLPGPWAKQKAALQAQGKWPVSAPPVPTPSIPTVPSVPEEDVVDIGYDRSDEDQQIDSLIKSISIIDAYNRWCGKMQVPNTGRKEGIKVSCPNPSHPDKDPSAWLNSEKNLWTCGPCEMGGDVYDIAAWYFGYDVPGYKQGHEFGKLRMEIAESLGYVVQRTPTGTIMQPPAEEEAVAEVVHLHDDGDDFEFDMTVFPELDWQGVLAKGSGETFLDIWMEQTKVDDVTEEFHFWNGMLALSMAMGREVTLFDSRPIFSNLFICIVGTTGAGKSKAKHHLDSLIERALPYDTNNPLSRGAFRAATPASAEALIWLFKKEITDPSDPKRVLGLAPVRGIVDYNELSSLVGRASRQGNVIIPTLMQFYDCERIVQTVSRTHGLDRAENPFASVITTTQPESLKKLLTTDDASSGFVNRWFFVGGKPKVKVAVGGAQVDVGPAVKPLQDVHGWAGSTRTLEWSPEAMSTFSDFFATHIFPLQEADRSGILNRLDLFMKKLVLLFTANEKSDVATETAVQQAIACWEYILQCYAVPRQQIGQTLQREIKDEIIRIMESFEAKFNRGITMRELHQRTNKKNWPDDIVRKTIQHLEMFDLLDITVTPKSGPGRKTRRYKYVG